MSARDSESGSSNYKGGSGGRGAGGLGNGGIGGGRGGGGFGGGAGRNGGYGSRTGLTTGTKMFGGIAQGRPGGAAMNPGAWGIRATPRVSQAPLNRPAVPGLLGPAVPAMSPPPAIEDVPLPGTIQNPFHQPSLGSVSDFISAMKSRYGWAAAQPGPGPATYSGPTGYWSRNPTSFPQHARDWEKGQWAENSIYGGMAPAPNKAELSNRNWRGPRQDIGAMTGGQGVPGFSSSGAPGFGGYR